MERRVGLSRRLAQRALSSRTNLSARGNGVIFIIWAISARVSRRKGTTENSADPRRIFPRVPRHRRAVTCRDIGVSAGSTRASSPDSVRDAAEAHAHDSRRHDSRLSHGVPGEREPTRTTRRRESLEFAARDDDHAGAKNSGKNRRSRRDGFHRGKRRFPRSGNVVSFL